MNEQRARAILLIGLAQALWETTCIGCSLFDVSISLPFSLLNPKIGIVSLSLSHSLSH